MKDIQILIDQSGELERNGDKDGALKSLSEAFDVLVEEAGAYALAQEPDRELEELHAQPEILFTHTTTYFKRNLKAATILTAMGVLFADMGEYENAEQKLQEAIRLTPENTEFDEPMKQLERLAGMVPQTGMTEDYETE